MSGKKWLRSDPDRPFGTDLEKLNALLRRLIRPTHEPLWFYRNRGTADAAQKHQASHYQDAENVEVMAGLGLHLPNRAHFFKGAGLKHERPSIEKTIQYARELHARGMLVSVYIGGTMFTDYFFKEVPEAINWARRDQDGLPITYSGMQLQRWFPCLNHPDYRVYVKRVLDVAVQEIKADEIFFDNQILRHEPRSCRCQYCIEHLRAGIRKKYTLEQCEDRYGFPEYPDVMPPVWSQACKPWKLDDVQMPHIQDWIDHRVSAVIEFYDDMNQYVKRQNPAIPVGMNIKGIQGHNSAFDHGICHGSFADILDWSCIDGYRPGRVEDTIHSEVRFWKSAHSTHIAVVDNPPNELGWAENQVYGYRKYLEGHGWIGGMGSCSIFTPLTQFLRANQRLFHQRTWLHDVAVLRAEPSTRYNCGKVHEQLMPFEQTLAVEKIPWGIIFDKQIDALEKYRIIALPEIRALSARWLARLDQFMRGGGGVIASGQAAQYNEWYRPHAADQGLARWLGHPPKGEYEVVQVGKGRLVYVPEWDVATPWDFKDWFQVQGQGLQPVRNRAVFLKAIGDATAGAPLTYRATGNDFVFGEAIANAEGVEHGVDLHFINYDFQAPVRPPLDVTVAVPAGKKVVEAVLLDPDQGLACKPRVLSTTSAAGVVKFQLATPRVYSLVQVRFGV